MSDLEIVRQYLEVFPKDAENLALLQCQLRDGEPMYDRTNFTGHITGSGIVLSPDHQKVLLIHHKVFNRWLQPGGHAEAEDANPLETGKRETEEETGIKIARTIPFGGELPLPIQIDSHHIAANAKRNEPEHYHHDFRYLFEAANENLTHQQEEVYAAKWFPLDAPEAENIAKIIVRIRAYKLM